MTDFIIAILILLIIGAAVVYIVKAKKDGVKCIGCPEGVNCPQKNSTEFASGCSGCSGCNGDGGCNCHAQTK